MEGLFPRGGLPAPFFPLTAIKALSAVKDRKESDLL
jgi:hypothetical protein